MMPACSASDGTFLENEQKAVSAERKDPVSVQFSSGRIVKFSDPNTKYTQLKYGCGEVNAKNSFHQALFFYCLLTLKKRRSIRCLLHSSGPIAPSNKRLQVMRCAVWRHKRFWSETVSCGITGRCFP